MSPRTAYDAIFCSSLAVEPEQLAGLTYQSIPTWDSVGHMSLMASLEDAFDIILEMEDILDFSSYEAGIRILSGYGIALE